VHLLGGRSFSTEKTHDRGRGCKSNFFLIGGTRLQLLGGDMDTLVSPNIFLEEVLVPSVSDGSTPMVFRVWQSLGIAVASSVCKTSDAGLIPSGG